MTTSKKNHPIFETEFMAFKPFFDNTVFFHIAYNVLYFYSDSGRFTYSLVFQSGRLFPL